MKPIFIFQQSKIWEGFNDDPPDPNMPVKKIRAKDINKARKKLPQPELGRDWVLVRIK